MSAVFVAGFPASKAFVCIIRTIITFLYASDSKKRILLSCFGIGVYPDTGKYTTSLCYRMESETGDTDTVIQW